MLPDHDQQPGNFPATRWSLVARVGAPNQDGHEALSELLRSYLPALRAHLVYRKRLPPDEAEDLLQEFVAHKVLQKNLLAQADRELGKFRTFLLTALDRFLANWRRDRHAGKRAPEGGMVNIDDELECAGREARPSDVFDVTKLCAGCGRSARRPADWTCGASLSIGLSARSYKEHRRPTTGTWSSDSA
jgi:hypothetical protein